MTKVPSKAVTPVTRPSLVTAMATKYGVEPEKFLTALKATAFHSDKEITNEQMLALLVVANEHDLNPWTKEIYAFPDKNKGGIVPIVSVDGWIKIVNSRPELAGFEFEFGETEGGELVWIACTITRKDRDKPVTVREYMTECKRDTGPWKSHPSRMLRHKAFIQAARLAFGYGGIYDPDEGERILEAVDVTPSKPATEAPRALPGNGGQPANSVPVEEFRKLLDASGIPENEFLEQFGAESLEHFPLDRVQNALSWLEKYAA